MNEALSDVGFAKELRNGIDSFCWWNFKTKRISIGEVVLEEQ